MTSPAFQLLIVFLTLASVRPESSTMQQPMLTFSEKENEITVSVVVNNLALPPNSTTPEDPDDEEHRRDPTTPINNSLHLSMYDSSSEKYLLPTNTSETSYTKAIGGNPYNKTCSFFTFQVQPRTEYRYFFQKGAEILGPFTFSLRDFSRTAETRFLVLADFDVSMTSAPTFKSLAALDLARFDAIIHAGDFSYDLSTDSGKNGDSFFDSMKGFVTRVPYLVVPGNHENFDKGNLFGYRFKMPGWSDRLKNNAYSLLRNGILFTFVNYDYFLKLHIKRTKEVLTFLAALFEAQKSNPDVSWRIVVSHRPIYCGWVEKSDCVVNPFYLKPFEDLYRKYSVDLILESHEHIYERLRMMAGYELGGSRAAGVKVGQVVEYRDPGLPLVVISGLAGNREQFPSKAETFNVNEKSLAGVHAYLDVRVERGVLQVDCVGAADGKVLDSARVVKKAGLSMVNRLSRDFPAWTLLILFVVMIVVPFGVLNEVKKRAEARREESERKYQEIGRTGHQGGGGSILVEEDGNEEREEAL